MGTVLASFSKKLQALPLGANQSSCLQDNKEDFIRLFCSEATTESVKQQILQRDPVQGITPLGYTIAWGYKHATDLLLTACW